MTDHDALLAVVKAAPDDDRPRLVYADWLEDRGEHERAEFIRVQVELAKCPPEVRADRRWHDMRYMVQQPWDSLRRRAHALLWSDVHSDTGLRSQWEAWLGVPDAVLHFPGGDRFFHRGFVESITSNSAAWLARGDAITSRHPVRTVRLTDRPAVEHRYEHFYGLPGRGYICSADPGPVVPFAGDGEFYSTWRPPSAERLLAAEWPGVAFELPPAFAESAHPRGGQGMFVGLASGVTVSLDGCEVGRVRDWQIVIDGDPCAEFPAGVIEAPDPAELPSPRRPRKPDFSARGWQPRFPRPR